MNKAKVLALLSKELTIGKVLPQQTITFKEFKGLRENGVKFETKLQLEKVKKFIVRSCAGNEDSIEKSNAGRFLSVLDVTPYELDVAIDNVFNSYDSVSDESMVLIQPLLENVTRSGVIFSNSPTSGQPYLIDNYVVGSRTNEITSGTSHGYKHICMQFDSLDKTTNRYSCHDEICKKLKLVVSQCKKILGTEFLDIEYGIDTQRDLYIFQARPLIIQKASKTNILENLAEIEDFLTECMRTHPFLSGDTTVYGVMPDWNPAEIIGRKPKPLALSLYRELVTDSIWAYQRDNYGYKTLRSFPLMVELGFQPFIDTRVSFNSLLPKGLSPQVEQKLVDFYLSKLKSDVHLHDKVEFEIVLSSWTFDLTQRLDNLPNNFSKDERLSISENLTDFTREVLRTNLVDQDIQRISQLESRRKFVEKSADSYVTKIYWLTEDCKRYGTLPFAGLARAAFISTQIIKSLEKICQKNYLFTNFVKGIDTVTTQMSKDLKTMDRNIFLEKYGHLRPGTYDIDSPTYRQAFNKYFGEETIDKMEPKEKTTRGADDLLLELANQEFDKLLGVESRLFIDFAIKAIYWREQAKFEFTKNLSTVLDHISQFGKELGINERDLAYLDIRDLLSCYSDSVAPEAVMRESIALGKKKHSLALELELPSLISEPGDVYSFTERDASPNFITLETMSGECTTDLSNLNGKVVLILGADPGYDWIFQKNILGLVTAYGGVNSHMAIRCNELHVPAVIGVGERLFDEMTKAHHIYANCSNRVIEYR